MNRVLVANLRLLKALEELLEILGDVPVVLLKGGALIAAGVRDMRERSMEDLDILVRPEDAEAVCGALAGMGYHKRPGYPGDYVSDGLVFDVHTSIWYLDDRETESFRARARPVACGDRSVLVPDAGDHLAYLVAHAAAHGVRQSKWVEDAAALRAGVAPARTDKEILRLGLSRAARWLSGQERSCVPAFLERKIPLQGHFLRFYLARDWRFRLAMLRGGLFPEEGFIKRRYDLGSSSKTFLWRLVRPFQVARSLVGGMLEPLVAGIKSRPSS